MAVKNRANNKDITETGDSVTESMFTDLIDSSPNIKDDKIKGAVDTIADLNALTQSDFEDGTYVQVNGYYSRGDGGGGVFYWGSTEAKSNHNGGTIINPDHLSTIGSANWYSSTGDSTDDSGSGCWKRPEKNFIVPEWFGTKPNDDTFNDVNAFQSIADSLYDGQIIECSGRDYFFDDDNTRGEAFTYFDGTLQNIQKIIINGNGSEFKLGEQTGYCIFEFRGLDSVVINDIIFNNDKANQDYPGKTGTGFDGSWDRAPYSYGTTAASSTTGLCGFNVCGRVEVNRCEIKEAIQDGLKAERCGTVVYNNIEASGQPIDLHDNGKFPAQIEVDLTDRVYCQNIYSINGNIGFGFATSSPGDTNEYTGNASYCEFYADNIVVSDCGQRNLSFEDPYALYLSNIKSENGVDFWGNGVEIIHIKKYASNNVSFSSKNANTTLESSLKEFFIENGQENGDGNLIQAFNIVSDGKIKDTTVTNRLIQSESKVDNITFDNSSGSYFIFGANQSIVENVTATGSGSEIGASSVGLLSNSLFTNVLHGLEVGDASPTVSNTTFQNVQENGIHENINRSDSIVTVNNGTKFINVGQSQAGNTEQSAIAADVGKIIVDGCYFIDDQATPTSFSAVRYYDNGGVVDFASFTNNTVDGLTGQIVFLDASTDTVVTGGPGFKLKDNGTATISNGTASITVNTNINITLSSEAISVTPLDNKGSATEFWVSSVAASSFDIVVDQDPAQDIDFAWKVDYLDA